jgi:hypothetical protein
MNDPRMVHRRGVLYWTAGDLRSIDHSFGKKCGHLYTVGFGLQGDPVPREGEDRGSSHFSSPKGIEKLL